ncbi:MAG: hypothetical protein ACREUP_08935, partial [Burkholderiales bacterium]
MLTRAWAEMGSGRIRARHQKLEENRRNNPRRFRRARNNTEPREHTLSALPPVPRRRPDACSKAAG